MNVGSHRYTYAAIALFVLSFAYWSAFATNAYYTFHEYSDLGTFSYNMYFDIHWPRIVHGLQLLVFGNHMAPDLLLILPIYALFPSSLTLLYIQAFILSFTGIVLFLGAKSLFKSSGIGLLFMLAYSLNPGVFGMYIFDFHTESFLTIFYILAFYSFIKGRKFLFIASTLLLLGVIEEATFLAMTLGLVLFAYGIWSWRRGEGAEKAYLALFMIFLSVAVLLFYILAAKSLDAAYAAGSYPGLPPILYAYNFAGSQLAVATTAPLSSFAAYAGAYNMPIYIAYALAIAIFGFGVAAIYRPLATLVLLFPWLVELFVVGNINFAFVFNQYFGFVIGPAAVASMLGMLRFYGKKHGTASPKMFHAALVSVVAASFLLFAFFPMFIYSKNVNNLSQDFTFRVSPQIRAYDAQLYSVMRLVPPNASLMTSYFIMPHVADRKDLELLQNSSYFFLPDYVLVDFNPNISLNAVSYGGQLQYFDSFFADHGASYDVYARNGTALLLKKV